MIKITLVDQETIDYQGATITIQQRFVNGYPCDWGYKTSSDISGIGQAGQAQAIRAAKEAIDWHKDK